MNNKHLYKIWPCLLLEVVYHSTLLKTFGYNDCFCNYVLNCLHLKESFHKQGAT
jgi:hypothetical protein